MIKVEPGDRIRAMLTVAREDMENQDKFIVMATRRGYIKKTPLEAFANLRRAGIRALVIEEDDDLIGAEICENGNDIILSSAKGMACRFAQNNEEVRPMGRTARGVTGMRFKLPEDYIVSMTVIHESLGDDDVEVDETETEEIIEIEEGVITESIGPELMVISDGGMGKRSLVTTYRKTRRGAKGVVSMKLRESEQVVTAIQIIQGDELLITTERGLLVRIPVDEIRQTGRAAKGVKIMNLNSGDRITGVARLISVATANTSNNTETTQDVVVDVQSEQVESE